MNRQFLLLLLTLIGVTCSAKQVKDTLITRSNDRIIITYNIKAEDNEIVIDFPSPPIIRPSDKLRSLCKGELGKLKVVIFDRVGNFGKVKWKGLNPNAFVIPPGVSYDRSSSGYFILGECQQLRFNTSSTAKFKINLPVFIAAYEKKQTYNVLTSTGQPLPVSYKAKERAKKGVRQTSMETELVAVQSSVEVEAQNEDLLNAMASIQLVEELLQNETEYPMSESLRMEIYNLRSMKNRLKEGEVIEKINALLLKCSEKEKELKDGMNSAALAAKAEEQALIEQQKQEEQAREKEAEEKAKIQEEKQQKRTLWMIIGGVLLAILGFVGNAVFKHFRDVRNQRSIMQMQESIARQAEHEATRRTREIVRNKAHQMANKGRSKMRQGFGNTGQPKINNNKNNNNKRRTI